MTIQLHVIVTERALQEPFLTQGGDVAAVRRHYKYQLYILIFLITSL